MSQRSYNPHGADLPMASPDLPPACLGSTCHIGNVTGLGCAGRCKLVADPDKPEPTLPKPPSYIPRP